MSQMSLAASWTVAQLSAKGTPREVDAPGDAVDGAGGRFTYRSSEHEETRVAFGSFDQTARALSQYGKSGNAA
jgi:hypothetical protein